MRDGYPNVHVVVDVRRENDGNAFFAVEADVNDLCALL